MQLHQQAGQGMAMAHTCAVALHFSPPSCCGVCSSIGAPTLLQAHCKPSASSCSSCRLIDVLPLLRGSCWNSCLAARWLWCCLLSARTTACCNELVALAAASTTCVPSAICSQLGGTSPPKEVQGFVMVTACCAADNTALLAENGLDTDDDSKPPGCRSEPPL
jgi:hypothetical protein